jgi:hypothetical protein
MQHNNYIETIRVLRQREVTPSFESISRLVVAIPSSKRRGFLWLTRSLGFGLGLMILGFPSVLRLALVATHVKMGTALSHVQVDETTRTANSSLIPHPSRSPHSWLISKSHVVEPPTIGPIKVNDASIGDQRIAIPSVSSRSTKSENFPSAVRSIELTPESHFSSSDVSTPDRKKLSLFLTSALSVHTSNNQAPLFSKLSTGIGYQVSGNVSVSIELQYRQANLKDGSQKLVLRDTTFSHQGSSYQNVIGGFVPTMSNQNILAGGIGLSYNLIADATLTPFVSVLTLVSSVGPFVSERLGLNMQLSGALSASLSGELSQLVGVRSSESIPASFGAGVQFFW